MSDDKPTDRDEAANRDMDSSPEVPANGDRARVVLELDDVFEALGHARRRYLLYTLVQGNSEETLPEMATKIVAWEQEKPVSEVTEEERRQVQASLYHSHVPKLADLGVLTYRQDENIVVQAQNTAQVQAVLDGAGGELDSRQEGHARGTDT